MPDEAAPSKRARQKQRRDQRLAEQRQAAARARRNRLLALGAVVAVIVAGVGFGVQRALEARAQQNQVAQQASEALDDNGCTAIETVPDQGGQHFSSAEQLASSPPESIYPQRPASSGIHLGQVALTGVYDKPVDERLILHNLEHGYAAFWYGADAPAEQVRQLQDWARQQVDGGADFMISAEYPGELPDGANFAFTSWGHRQLCESFATSIGQNFLTERANSPSVPEFGAGPHTEVAPGVVDPGATDGPLLYPPLGEADLSGPQNTDSPTESES